MATKTLQGTQYSFTCTECGWGTAKWIGRCGECGEWGTVVETGTRTGIVTRMPSVSLPEERRAKPIAEVGAEANVSFATGVGEFDRVLGTGLVPGSTVLLSGEPGVGKSTLLLSVAGNAARRGMRVLYLTAEESAAQVRLRAERIHALEDELFIAAETRLAVALGQIDAVRPNLVIADSVQTFTSETLDSSAGGPAQVREIAATLAQVARERNIAMLLVGHVTKDGSIAGPRTLEHLVDVVCQFEGDHDTSLRFVRAMKNRYGSTDEVGCFVMEPDGIAEVPDPSGIFLSRASGTVAGAGSVAGGSIGANAVSGTCVTMCREGRRVIPVEIQALSVPTNAPMPRRVTHGVDAARVAMILAVLERRCGLRLGGQEIYVSTVGGMRATEPAADLAIALALASAVLDKPIPHGTTAYGEVSLAGTIRPAQSAPSRSNEAARLGLSHVIDERYETLAAAVRELR